MSANNDLVWEIGVILSCYEKSNQKDKNALYAKAIQINTKIGYGLVYTIDDFIGEVSKGLYVDSDGYGYALDENGVQIRWVGCDIKDLEELKRKGCVYVHWFNK